jgi:Mg-chelatase subunit ChlD
MGESGIAPVQQVQHLAEDRHAVARGQKGPPHARIDTRLLEDGVSRVDAIGGTAMRDALQTAERYFRDYATLGRRALFVITDGNDASTLSTSECRRLVERSGAAVYAVRLVHDMAPASRNDDELDRLAEISGGVAEHIDATANIAQVALEIAHRIRNE